MKFLTVGEAAEKWGIAQRTVRNYCANGRIPGAVQEGRNWRIPESAMRPERINARPDLSGTLLGTLREEKESGMKGGIYHRLQIEFTYNSNRIEGSRLTEDQTRSIFETRTICVMGGTFNVDDVIETSNHFRCIDLVIDRAGGQLSESFIRLLHRTLKTGTRESRRNWTAAGDYKKLPNKAGNTATALPEEVHSCMEKLLREYHTSSEKSLEDLLDFHYEFERIHPFQDGNGRVGRLILLKECLKHDIVPPVISEDLKTYYYRGLDAWPRERGYLMGTCQRAQKRVKDWLDYFRIPYN